LRSRKRTLAVLFTIVLIATCISIALGGFLVYAVPQRAEQMFGPSNPALGWQQRFYYSLNLLMNEKALTMPLDPNGSPVVFEIPQGEATISVINRLWAMGLIKDAEDFRHYLLYTGLDTTLQAGEYTLSPSLTPVQIAQALQDATPEFVNFRILPGWRLEEIAASLTTSGLPFSAEDFLRSTASVPPSFEFNTVIPAEAGLEGFMYPDTYRFGREISVDDFIGTILQNFSIKLSADIRQGFNRQGLDVFESVTLASIVERESVNDQEMPLIASVFLNRLNAGIKLDTDPSVQYAIGYNPTQDTWWTNPLSLNDLEIDSLYNTYRYPGLPPGPIANPSLSALRAVAFPAQSPYYYFRAACDGSGSHVFAETFEQHQANACAP
jgi:UPF0755 protein